jgi:hypothetical protein
MNWPADYFVVAVLASMMIAILIFDRWIGR